MELESPDSLARQFPSDFRKERELGPLWRFLLPLAERGGGVLNVDIIPTFVPLLWLLCTSPALAVAWPL